MSNEFMRIYVKLFVEGIYIEAFVFLDINPDEDIVSDINKPFCLLITLALASSKPYQG